MRSLGLVATQTLTFLSTDIEGWAAVGQRLGDTRVGARAGHQRLIRARLAAHGGEEAGSRGDGVVVVFSLPHAHRPVTVAHGG
jgi:class 3 adenylate cyclase